MRAYRKNVTSRLFFLIFRTLYISILSCVLCFLDFRVNRSFYKKVHS
nr:MAG TPA_asm: hypothetical protein [Caudoviricetes sp.]